MIRKSFTILTLVALSCGCQQEREWGFQPGTGGSGGGMFPFGSNGGGNSQQNGGFGSGDLNPVDLRNDLDQLIEYPQLKFTGDGNVASIDSRNPTQIATSQEFSREYIRLHTTRFTSSDSTINKEVKKLVGTTEFIRTTKQELINREDEDGFRNLDFVMYTSRSTATSGFGTNTLSYSSPLPAAIIPVDRYDALASGPVSFAATVLDSDGSRFNVVSTISEIGRSGNTIKILHMTEIQGDDNGGRLYDKLHLSWKAIYTIDMVGKKVMVLESDDYYHNKERGRRNMTATMQLCAYTLKGQTQSFPCPNY